MKCTICNFPLGDELIVITSPDRFELGCGIPSAGYRRTWRDCPNCGAAINVLPPESREKLAAIESSYYEIDFAGSDIRQKYDKVMSLPPQGSDNAGRVARMISTLESFPTTRDGSWRVLDIGAGTGVFLSGMLRASPRIAEAMGVEPDPRAARHLEALGLFTVINECFPIQRDIGRFDLVTLNKVIEHIDEPVAFLAEAARSLLPGGLLYVEVPDRLTTQRRPGTDNILGALHRHLHGPESLARMVRAAGLVCLSVERIIEPSGKLTVYAYAARPEMLDLWDRDA
ncbi:class I SAM-dependent methyltransferase [Magnetospirillum sp. 15-1]|uniref:class I SAM-dependent methyltransferase n=1 Tax=Magnetospirillum sp. 15-1 TaxID=1979370 RepID=UPI0014830D94|nr:class I SAM-dependent methyltransferase [Magnetospirillum sp. 15-1]